MFLDNMDMLESDLYGSDFDIDPVDISIWIAKDGTEYLISEMQTSHIKNCIKMIQRSKNHWREEYLEPLIRELIRRKQES